MTEPLTPEVRDLLTAIRDALDVPISHWHTEDEQARARILDARAAAARITVEGILESGHHIAHSTAYLAGRTAETPITYTVWQPLADSGEQA
ncbi:hypothetical protein [Streptomyces sp.]|uniref:hypothetical protein n=1 Tax=Streptomyces sp. TaxID=1931 RepID=UPI002F425B85